MVRLKLVRKRPVHAPRMSPGEERDFKDEEAKRLLEEHPGWFADVTAVKGGAKSASPETPPPSRTKPFEPAKKK
jgi:hypothetical protein